MIKRKSSLISRLSGYPTALKIRRHAHFQQATGEKPQILLICCQMFCLWAALRPLFHYAGDNKGLSSFKKCIASHTHLLLYKTCVWWNLFEDDPQRSLRWFVLMNDNRFASFLLAHITVLVSARFWLAARCLNSDRWHTLVSVCSTV